MRCIGVAQLAWPLAAGLLCLALTCLVHPVAGQGCPAGNFGPYCNYSCNSCFDTSHCVSVSNGSGGCSDGICIAGFGQPPLCQAPCGQGVFANKFGRNCDSQCHCSVGAACDPVSGNCDRGCDPTWAGPGCQTQLPAMKRPPTIVSNDCAGLVVQFLRFNASIDQGSSSIDFYRLQIDGGTGGVVWSDVQDFLSVNPDPYSTNLAYGSLNASLVYRFRLTAHFSDPYFDNLFGPASNASEPARPSCIRITALGPFTITVAGSELQMSWNSSAAPTVVAYNITVTPLRTGDCANLSSLGVSARIPASNQSYRFPGAIWTTYLVSVFSIDGAGSSSAVFASSQATPEARPATPVTVSLLGKGTDWLNFTWTPPACDLRLGSIREYQYTVYQIASGKKIEVAKGRPSSVQQVPIAGLSQFTVYNISVMYVNSMGSSPEAEFTMITDAEPTTTSASTSTSTITTTTATTSTSTSTSIGTSTTSTTTASTTPTSTSTSTITSAPTTTTSTPSTTASSTTSTTSTSASTSTTLSTTSATTSTAASTSVAPVGPDPPTGLSIASVASTAANVTWTPPSTLKAPLMDYRIQVVSPISLTFNTSNAYYVLTGLQPATVYTVQVTSRSAAGIFGPPSVALAFTTAQLLSQQVASLGNSSRSDSAISVAWSAPPELSDLAQFQVQVTLLASRAPGVSPGATATVNVTASGRSLAVSSLQPSSQYSLCVTPVYSSGRAGVQRCVAAWTAPAAFAVTPAVPRLLGSAGSATANVNLTTVVDYRGGQLTGFLVGLLLATNASSSGRRRRAVAPDSVGLAGHAVVAAFAPAELPSNFTLGDGVVRGGFANPRLAAASVYNLRLAAYSEVDGVIAFAVSAAALEIRTAVAPDTVAGAATSGLAIGLVAAVIVLAILLVAIVLIVMIYRVFLRQRTGKDYANFTDGGSIASLRDAEPRSAACWSATSSPREPRCLLVDLASNRSRADVMSVGSGVTCRAEFAALPQGYHPSRTCHRARSRGDDTASSLPYDQNLVTLKDPNIYHNACWVDGYIRREAYISAQSPVDKESTAVFWRIVAEHNVAQIVNLSNENSVNFFRYWPEPGNRAEFPGVQVQCLSEAHRNFFCRRQLAVNGLEVTQFQFLSWPDTGVPKTPLPLVALYYAVKVASRIEHGPLLVHCPTALSRTAVFIALDWLLQQAMHERCVSVFKCALRLRKARANSLPDQREFAFIYDLLFEAMLTEGRNLVRPDVRQHLRALRAQNPRLRLAQSYMSEHFDFLQRYVDRPVCTPPTAAAAQSDRDPSVLPCDDCRVRLADPSVFINAIWLDSFDRHDDIVVTQTPLEATEAAFWTMVLENRLSHVVDLQPGGDPRRCFYPQPPETQRALGRGDSLTLRLQGRTDRSCVLLVESQGHPPLQVTVHTCADLYATPHDPMPVSAAAMLRIVRDIPPSAGHLVLVCLNGANRCGLFAACLLAARQLHHDGFADIYHSVKWMKLRRPQLVPTLKQYEFIFEFLKHFVKQRRRQVSNTTDIRDPRDLGESIFSHSQAPVLLQREPGRVAHHYLLDSYPGHTMQSTASSGRLW